MSVNAMKPTFTTRAGYIGWRRLWTKTYARAAEEIRQEKAALKEAQRALAAMPGDWQVAQSKVVSKMARDLTIKRVIAHKMNTLLEEAKQRRDRIIGMHKSLAEQFDSFPLTLENCRNVDFHFNKGSLEYDFLPMWTLKASGKSYYVHHIDSQCPFSTRELPEGSTRGMLRFKKCDITIDKDGVATLTPRQVELKVAA